MKPSAGVQNQTQSRSPRWQQRGVISLLLIVCAVRLLVCAEYFIIGMVCILVHDWKEGSWRLLVAICVCPAWDGVEPDND